MENLISKKRDISHLGYCCPTYVKWGNGKRARENDASSLIYYIAKLIRNWHTVPQLLQKACRKLLSSGDDCLSVQHGIAHFWGNLYNAFKMMLMTWYDTLLATFVLSQNWALSDEKTEQTLIMPSWQGQKVRARLNSASRYCFFAATTST